MSTVNLRSRWATTVALLGAGAIAGVIGATAFGAGAATTSGSPTATSTSSSNSDRPDHDGPFDGTHGGPDGQNPDENSVTNAQSATLKAAALKRVPGGTVVRVETDSGDAAYEVHMTEKNGKQVTVKFDKNLRFVAVEDGMGT